MRRTLYCLLMCLLALNLFAACGDDDDSSDDDSTNSDSDDDDDDDDNDDDNDDDDDCVPALLYSENFDSYSPGDPLPASWSVYDEDMCAITDIVSDSAPNSLSVGGLTHEHLKYMWNSLIFIPLPAYRCETWSVSASINIKGAPSQNSFYFCLAQDDPQGNLVYSQCAESSWSDPQDTWRTFRLDIDETNMTIDSYIDDVHETGPFALEPNPLYLLLYVNGVSDGTHFSDGVLFDDIMIYDQGWTP